ncbi:hypothetical protein TSMEX_007337, partial [Taenia solium]
VYSLDLEKKAEEYAERCTLLLPENSNDPVFKYYQGTLGECLYELMKPYFEGDSCFDCPPEDVCINNLCSRTKAPTSEPQTTTTATFTTTATVTTSTSSAIWAGEVVSCIILLVYLSVH